MAKSMALRDLMKYTKASKTQAPKAPKVTKSPLAMSATKKGKC